MSSNTAYIHHQRTTSGGKKFIVKSARPGLPKSFSSGRLPRNTKSKSTDSIASTEDPEMATTFHQFCTTCEKQIAVPNNSILYCSERCRHSDGQHTTSSVNPRIGLHSGPGTSCPSPTTPLSEYEAFIGRPLVSRRKPSSAIPPPPSSSSYSISSTVVPDLHDGKADMDPTEWKPDGHSATAPAITVGCSGRGGSAAPPTKETTTSLTATTTAAATVPGSDCPLPRSRSEAFLYLAQFHRSTENFATLSDGGSASSSMRRTGTSMSSVSSSVRSFAAAAAIFDPDFSFAGRADGRSDSGSSSSDSSDSERSSGSVDGTARPATAASSAAPSIVVSLAGDDEDGGNEEGRVARSLATSGPDRKGASNVTDTAGSAAYPRVTVPPAAPFDDGIDTPQGTSAPSTAPAGLGKLLRLTTKKEATGQVSMRVEASA